MIRLAEEKDTREIWESHVSSIRNICSRNYRPDQIERWSAFQYNHEHWVKTMKTDQVFVVEDNGCVRGFCHVAFPKSDKAEVCLKIGRYNNPKI